MILIVGNGDGITLDISQIPHWDFKASGKNMPWENIFIKKH